MLGDIDCALEQTLAAYIVDSDRVYLTGLSMGGYGTWLYGARHVERFAALLAICGGGDIKDAAALARLMDEPEYDAFLFNADGVLTVRDANQDNRLSVDESGLSQDAFDALDGDRSETLEIRELREAVAFGDID